MNDIDVMDAPTVTSNNNKDDRYKESKKYLYRLIGYTTLLCIVFVIAVGAIFINLEFYYFPSSETNYEGAVCTIVSNQITTMQCLDTNRIQTCADVHINYTLTLDNITYYYMDTPLEDVSLQEATTAIDGVYRVNSVIDCYYEDPEEDIILDCCPDEGPDDGAVSVLVFASIGAAMILVFLLLFIWMSCEWYNDLKNTKKIEQH